MAREIGPRIIVQSGGYTLGISNHLTEEYKKATKESAKKGYAILIVSIFRRSMMNANYLLLLHPKTLVKYKR
jgi:hypothetical protein